MLNINESSVIVSADDFGISQIATANILKLVKAGKLDRVEVMMSKNLTNDQVSELLNSGVKIDIHLHLAKDKIDKWQTEPREMNPGILERIVPFVLNFFEGKTDIGVAEAEWHKQIREFRELFGKNPDGISSHEHIHFFPSYFKLVLKLSAENGIKYIRFGKNYLKEKNKVCLILGWLRKRNTELFVQSKMKSSDYMASFDWIGDFDKFLKKLPAGKEVELIFHPEKENELAVVENL